MGTQSKQFPRPSSADTGPALLGLGPKSTSHTEAPGKGRLLLPRRQFQTSPRVLRPEPAAPSCWASPLWWEEHCQPRVPEGLLCPTPDGSKKGLTGTTAEGEAGSGQARLWARRPSKQRSHRHRTGSSVRSPQPRQEPAPEGHVLSGRAQAAAHPCPPHVWTVPLLHVHTLVYGVQVLCSPVVRGMGCHVPGLHLLPCYPGQGTYIFCHV